MVSGPYIDQSFTCVKGSFCIQKGPLRGLGLTADDRLVARKGCSLDWARGSSSTSMNVAALSGANGETELYFALSDVVQIAAGEYSLCWCSSKGESCDNMDLSPAGTSTLYLEAFGAKFIVEGPGTGAEIECFQGQPCFPALPDGVNLAEGDRLTAQEQCGESFFLRGLPGEGYAITGDGYQFGFVDSDGLFDPTAYLTSDPGFFRLCWCRPSNATGNVTGVQCVQGTDFNVAAGLFIAVGPYSGQWFSCSLGSQCLVTGLRGVSLASGDWLVPLAGCGSAVASGTFPDPLPINGTLNDSVTVYDFGHLQLEGGKPEGLKLCWCSARSPCSAPEEFRALAMDLYVQCPPGTYELYGEETKCQECPVGYYCPGGWPAQLRNCPSGSTSPRGSKLPEECQCRRGSFWDASIAACLACPAGTFKDQVGRLTECERLCPSGTTSLAGAANVWECYCSGDAIDTDPSLDSLQCSELMGLSSNSSADAIFAATQAYIHRFGGSLQVADASTESLLVEVDDELRQMLGLSSRSSLDLAVRFDDVNFSWHVDFQVSSSDLELAEGLHDAFDPSPFAAWIFQSMAGTALDSAQLHNRTPVEQFLLACPDGLGLHSGSFVKDLTACKCPHGKQPGGAGGGLSAGCVDCPVGKYKSSVEDASCTSCPSLPSIPAPLTTLQVGAIAYSACTCPGGYVNHDPQNPSSCEECGIGFYCLGGTHRQACDESQTTVNGIASSDSECFCAAGFRDAGLGVCEACVAGKFKSEAGNAECADCPAGTFSGEGGQSSCLACAAGEYSTGSGSCQSCLPGRFSATVGATSAGTCLPCPIGKWSNETGAASGTSCVSCVEGSTTEAAGTSESLCVLPGPGQTRNCVSGRLCVADDITGFGLRNGHRLAVGFWCGPIMLAVPYIVASGISQLATNNGSTYAWGEVSTDFLPFGGNYSLCWCANMGPLSCDDLSGNFLLSAGQLSVTGPNYNELECLRGADCMNLAFSGYGLLETDQVAVRRGGCGGETASQISPSNLDGLGALQAANGSLGAPQAANGSVNGSVNGYGYGYGSGAAPADVLLLGFGTSDADSDFHISLDASDAGYFLCWCASERGLANACNTPQSFDVNAGRLRVTGPNTNQESACSVGQACSITGIRGVGMKDGDRLMVLSDCGKGAAIPGFPAGGLLETIDGATFEFSGQVSNILMSVPGIFRVCFCKPLGSEVCNSSTSFRARVGLMTASGPFEQTTTCEVGSACTVQMSGIGLDIGDKLLITAGQCGSSTGLGAQGYPLLQQPLALEMGSAGLEVPLGILPDLGAPGRYSLCWCPRTGNCTTQAFRAPAGQLQVDCPQGTFALGPSSGQICNNCTRGYYCAGGSPSLATRVPCADGQTTLGLGFVTSDACVCDRGYVYDTVALTCSPCPLGFYKTQPGNFETCDACPDGYITYNTGSVFSSSCFASPSLTTGAPTANVDDNETNVSNASNATVDTAPDLVELLTKNESEVPAVSFNMSLANLPTNQDAESLRNQLIAIFKNTLASATRLSADAIQIDFIGLVLTNTSNATGRRLSASMVVVTIKQRSVEEATITAADMDADSLTSEILTAVQQHPTLGDSGITVVAESRVTRTSSIVKCPPKQSVPPGVPVLSAADCQCSLGHGFDPTLQTCEPCNLGEYKATVDNGICTRCPAQTSTLEVGATAIEQCRCEAGLYTDESGACVECTFGHYCPGTGQAVVCPDNSTTIALGRQLSDCVCLAGYYFASAADFCEPCPRRKYKATIGNGDCALTCPTNADSEPGSTSLDDCFCQPRYHAHIDSAGKLASCTSCSYSGLTCPGGFEGEQNGTKIHAQPRATPGFFQTGLTSAVECDVLLPDGATVCGDNYPDLCQRCPEGAGFVLAVRSSEL
ncbi:unnamed protein product [Effrenium voratum]|nr:unnamed protein product [Effrenium voratum]